MAVHYPFKSFQIKRTQVSENTCTLKVIECQGSRGQSLISQKKYWHFEKYIVLPDKFLSIIKGLCIQKRYCVSINYNFLCPGKVLWVQERYCVPWNDILCPGKVLCVQERYSVPWKGIVCPGMIFCAQERYCVSRNDILCPGKVLCV